MMSRVESLGGAVCSLTIPLLVESASTLPELVLSLLEPFCELHELKIVSSVTIGIKRNLFILSVVWCDFL